MINIFKKMKKINQLLSFYIITKYKNKKITEDSKRLKNLRFISDLKFTLLDEINKL